VTTARRLTIVEAARAILRARVTARVTADEEGAAARPPSRTTAARDDRDP